MIFHCVACILYNSQSLVDTDEKFLAQLINYSASIDEHYTKQSINWVVCALFSKRPDLLDTLTGLIDLKSLGSREQPSSWGKLTASPDQSTRASLHKRCVSLIETLSYAIQSEQIARLFVRSSFFHEFSRFFVELVKSFVEYQSASGAQKPSVSIEPSFVRLFVALAQFECGQDWFNSEMGCAMWQSLVSLLNSSHDTTSTNKLPNAEELAILVIRMLKHMLFFHASNQAKFATFVTKLIRDASNPVNFYIDPAQSPHPRHSSPTISAFLHQLILQIMLEDPTLTVNFERRTSLFKSSCNSSLGSLTHPKYGTGANFRTIELPLTKTCAQVLNLLSDVPISQVLAVAKSSSVLQQKEKEQQQMMAAESAETMLEVKDLLSKLKMQGAAGDSAAEFGAVLSNTTAASKKTDEHSSMFFFYRFIFCEFLGFFLDL